MKDNISINMYKKRRGKRDAVNKQRKTYNRPKISRPHKGGFGNATV